MILASMSRGGLEFVGRELITIICLRTPLFSCAEIASAVLDSFWNLILGDEMVVTLL